MGGRLIHGSAEEQEKMKEKNGKKQEHNGNTTAAEPAVTDAPGKEAAPEKQPEAQTRINAETGGSALAEEKDAEAAARKNKARRKRRKAVRRMLLRLLVVLLVTYVLLFQLVGITVMPNGDMYPRIDAGDLVLFYRLDRDVRAQDVIVFEKDVRELRDMMIESAEETGAYVPDSVLGNGPQSSEEEGGALGSVKRWLKDAAVTLRLKRDENKQLFICRVVATAGDTVEISQEGRLIVNGNAMIETNIFSQTTAYVSFTEYPLQLQEGECFVMADLRSGGADSRFFGPVKEEEILGTVITIMRRNNL